jgi:hypothetical protein
MPEDTTRPDAAAAEAAASAEQALHVMEAAGTAMFEGLSKAQREISGFVAERIRQDVETQSALLRCRSFDDVRDVQAQFLKTAMDQYAAEATKLMRIGAEMIAPLRPGD